MNRLEEHLRLLVVFDAALETTSANVNSLMERVFMERELSEAYLASTFMQPQPDRHEAAERSTLASLIHQLIVAGDGCWEAFESYCHGGPCLWCESVVTSDFPMGSCELPPVNRARNVLDTVREWSR